MSADIEQVSTEVLHPTTGEVIDLAEYTVDQVAEFHEQIKDLQAHAKTVRARVSDELDRRRRLQGGSSATVEGSGLAAKRKLSSPKWNAEGVIAALAGMVEDGVLPADEADALVPEVPVRKPNGTGLNALMSRLIADEEFGHVGHLQACKTQYVSWEVTEVRS